MYKKKIEELYQKNNKKIKIAAASTIYNYTKESLKTLSHKGDDYRTWQPTL